MAGRCNVYLVPGFFGFTSLGAFNYFYRVSEVLDDALKERCKEATVVECQTRPTGSIRRRADRLLQDIIDTGGLEADELHLIGHSTGGLDVRMLVTPGVRLRPGPAEEQVASRVRTAVTISTPHFGTPLASYFTTLPGRHLLEVLTLLATSTGGRQTIYLGARALSLIAKLDDYVGLDKTTLDFLSHRLLEKVTRNADDPIWRFLKEVSSDQGAVVQLTPEGMDLFNAAVVDRSSVSYGCVLTASPRPFAHELSTLLSLEGAALAAVYGLLHTVSGRQHRHYPYPSLAEQLKPAVQESYPFPVDHHANDAVVPLLSQIYGDVVSAAVADHLDVVGQFRGAGGGRESLTDWLPSGSRFGEERFRQVWRDVAEFIELGKVAAKAPEQD
jgi:hypothetical protein